MQPPSVAIIIWCHFSMTSAIGVLSANTNSDCTDFSTDWECFILLITRSLLTKATATKSKKKYIIFLFGKLTIYKLRCPMFQKLLHLLLMVNSGILSTFTYEQEFFTLKISGYSRKIMKLSLWMRSAPFPLSPAKILCENLFVSANLRSFCSPSVSEFCCELMRIEGTFIS